MPNLTGDLVFSALRSVSFCGDPAAADEHLQDVAVPANIREQITAAAGIVAGHSQRRDYGRARQAAAYLAERIKLPGPRTARPDETDRGLADQIYAGARDGLTYARTAGHRSVAPRSTTSPRGWPT